MKSCVDKKHSLTFNDLKKLRNSTPMTAALWKVDGLVYSPLLWLIYTAAQLMHCLWSVLLSGWKTFQK